MVQDKHLVLRIRRAKVQTYTLSMAISRWLVLGFFACRVPGVPHIAAQQAPAIESQPSFEVASIKPSRPDDRDHNWNSSKGLISIENYTLRRLIRMAYGLKSDSQVLGGPDWIGKQAFDIEARFDDAEVAKMQTMNNLERFEETRLALRSLLRERFQLNVTQGAQSIPVYALVVAKSGAKLVPSAPQLDDSGKPKADQNHSLHDHDGHMTAAAITMSSFVDWLTLQPESDCVVLDRTGLTGDFDFKLDWAPDYGEGIPPDAQYPGLFTALHEQLGLELKPDKGPVEVVVVESAKKPEFD